jgi:hypothetical protein
MHCRETPNRDARIGAYMSMRREVELPPTLGLAVSHGHRPGLCCPQDGMESLALPFAYSRSGLAHLGICVCIRLLSAGSTAGLRSQNTPPLTPTPCDRGPASAFIEATRWAGLEDWQRLIYYQNCDNLRNRNSGSLPSNPPRRRISGAPSPMGHGPWSAIPLPRFCPKSDPETEMTETPVTTIWPATLAQ